MRTSNRRSALRPPRLSAWAVCVLTLGLTTTCVPDIATRAGAHRRQARIALLALAILMVSATSAAAQYAVTQVQPLAFGYLTQGVTEVVPYTDTFRRGVVTVNGAGQAWIRLVVPISLISLEGSTIPVQFLAGDVASQENAKTAVAFDPTASTRVNLSRGTASLFIGGRAVPALTQRAGLYSATMTIIVSPTQF